MTHGSRPTLNSGDAGSYTVAKNASTFITAYTAAIQALAHAGWLIQSEAATFATLADSL